MPSLEKSDLVTTNVQWRWPSVHPEGRKFVVVALAVAALFWWVIDWDWLGYAAFALSFGIAAFFRDPIRTTPVGQGLIVAPADGLVTMITNVPPPRELWGEGGLSEEPVVRVSIFMSVFDVHINRTPITGTWSRARTAPRSPSPRSPGWWRGGSCPGSRPATASSPGSASG